MTTPPWCKEKVMVYYSFLYIYIYKRIIYHDFFSHGIIYHERERERERLYIETIYAHLIYPAACSLVGGIYIYIYIYRYIIYTI